jgi:ribosomal protein L14E/L6E/L27E
MVYNRFVEIGRLVYINTGPYKGKVAVIVDVLDQNRVSWFACWVSSLSPPDRV